MLIKRLLLLIFLIVQTILILAESEYSFEDSLEVYKYKPQYGGYFHYGYNLHITNFRELPGIPCCSPQFSFGSAPGFSFGGLYDMYIKDKWGLGLRLGYSNSDAVFNVTETTIGLIAGTPSNVQFEHNLSTRIDLIDFKALASYEYIDNLKLYAGLNLNYVYLGELSQYEKITTLQGTYIDGRRIRNEVKQEIQDLSAIQAGITLGIGYEMPMNENRSLIISPEAFYTFNFLSPVSDVSWLPMLIRGGISIRYKEPPPPPLPPAAPAEPCMPDLPNPESLPTIDVAVEAAMVDSLGNISNDVNVVIEDFTSSNMRPLLNYVFFGNNSFEIPDRYVKLSRSETNIFSLSKLTELDALETYYYVLNIYGLRLREKSSCNVTLIGSNSDEGEEKNNKELSLNRAESVKKYLQEIWGIEENRIKIKAENLPDKASKDKDMPEQANEENRRVEILVSDEDLNEPVFTKDTKRTISAIQVLFKPIINSVIPIKNWEFFATQESNTLLERTAQGTPEDVIWDLTGKTNNRKLPTTSGQVNYYLSVTDELGREKKSSVYTLPIQQISINKKRSQKIKDTEYEYYSLILFDFGKSDLRGEHKKVVDFVKERIATNSTVYVKGYTDSMGDEEGNLKLATKRAKTVGLRLKIPESQVIGIGETPNIFNNDLPEGRFYCRTVQIEIVTPVAE